mgnify:CR=1 FL=1
MVGFDNGSEVGRVLDGRLVSRINADLTSTMDLTTANFLPENSGIAFMGDTKGGAFDISSDVAAKILEAEGNPNGRPNNDVVRPWVNGLDITRRPRNMWIIDFGVDMSEVDASQYEAPYEHICQHVKPVRIGNRRESYAERWWIHAEPRPAMRSAFQGTSRYIVTPGISKHRIFTWSALPTLPDHALFVFVRDDDYFLGVLHSRLHELWALRQGTSLEDRPRYTPTTTFETFPFPWPPGSESAGDPRVNAIAQAAHVLVEQRDAWLNPPDTSEAELKKRTLTNLYNERPDWLALAHRKLDVAVLDAYGWPHNLSDEEILERLLALNLERAARQG